MAYRNKTYVCFDADEDMLYYNLMKAWKENEKFAFNFHNAHEINNLRDGSSETTIKQKLRERLADTKVLVILIGEKTKNLYKYVRWEIEYAIEKGIPIIAVNLNKLKSMDNKLCPPLLKDKLAMHIAFGQKIMDFALNNWPSQHTTERAKGKTWSFHYPDKIYDEL
ncbi:MAG: TIR domain-containing protein [Bacteroidetes bacterium]|nr:TIR domain-containing protein [Bacteroidota bacterium]